ncbi:hypothetical protein HIM_00354 [Hirsutella minnesotensis 3608]|nr:hypothetical protein HIM_00354 [Hirsutella minnesotensis 3608]
MAVIPEIPSLSVIVKTDGQPAVEYDPPIEPSPTDKAGSVDPDDGPSICRYIESITDQTFSIEAVFSPSFQIRRGYDHLFMNVEVDGDWLAWDHCRIGKYFLRKPKALKVDTCWISANIPGQGTAYDLKFCSVAAIEIASLDRINQDVKIARNMGSIVIKVGFGKGLSTKKDDSISDNVLAQSKNGERIELAMKALKGRALTHGATLSARQNCDGAGLVTTWFTKQKPIATFIFKYRSQAGLRSEVILPPHEVEDTVDNDILQMSVEELQKIAMDARRSNKSVIKRECDDDAAVVPTKHVKVKEVDGILDITEDSD